MNESMKEIKQRDLDLTIERKSYSKYAKKKLRRRKTLKTLGMAATAFAMTVILFTIIWFLVCDKLDACGLIFVWCGVTFFCGFLADFIWEDFDPEDRTI